LTNIRNDANVKIEEINDFARGQILASQNTAIMKVDNTVKEEFQEQRITKLMEKTAREITTDSLEGIFNNKINDANSILINQLQIMPKLIINTDKIRNSNRPAYVYIDSIAKSSSDLMISNFAKEIITEKTIDYIKYSENAIKDNGEEQIFDVLRIDNKLLKSNDTVNIVNGLLDIIDKNDTLEFVSISFALLNYYGYRIEMFDFNKAKQLKSQIKLNYKK
jgi:hypothetical protein